MFKTARRALEEFDLSQAAWGLLPSGVRAWLVNGGLVLGLLLFGYLASAPLWGIVLIVLVGILAAHVIYSVVQAVNRVRLKDGLEIEFVGCPRSGASWGVATEPVSGYDDCYASIRVTALRDLRRVRASAKAVGFRMAGQLTPDTGFPHPRDLVWGVDDHPETHRFEDLHKGDTKHIMLAQRLSEMASEQSESKIPWLRARGWQIVAADTANRKTFPPGSYVIKVLIQSEDKGTRYRNEFDVFLFLGDRSGLPSPLQLGETEFEYPDH